MKPGHSIRCMSAALACLVLAACGSSSNTAAGSEYIHITDEGLRSRIGELAACPSPLDRLGIDRAGPLVSVNTPGSATIRIPASDDERGTVIGFEFEPDPDTFGKPLRINWTVELSPTAQELDLGDSRLLNPARFPSELNSAIKDYLSYYHQAFLPDDPNTPDYPPYKVPHDQACLAFGLLLDAVAVTTNPALRDEMTKQKHRRALDALFHDKPVRRDPSFVEPEPDPGYDEFYDG